MGSSEGRLSWVFPVLLGLAVFSLYVYTLCPTVYMGDSGELIAAAFSLGGGHPSGYILYSILGKAFTFLPVGNIAYKLNFLSACFSALSAVVVFFIIYELTANRAASASGALFFSLSLFVWQSSVIAEVYALNIFLCSLLFYTGVKVIQAGTPDIRLLPFSAFVAGIGMGNHHTIALMLPALAFAFLIRGKRYITVGNLIFVIMFFLLGVSVNVALILRSRSDILFDYSYASSLKKFLAAFLRKTYGSASADVIEATVKPGLHWFNGIRNMFEIFLKEFGYLILFAIAGLFHLLRKNWRIPAFFTVILITWTGFLIGGTDYNPIDRFAIEQFLPPLFIPLGILTAIGLLVLLGALSSFADRKGLRLVWPALSLALAIVPAVTLLPRNISRADLSGNYFGYLGPRDAMSMLPAGSLLLNYTDDYVFGSWYLQLVERYREDIVIAGAKFQSNKWQFPGSLKNKFYDLYSEIYSDFTRRDMFLRDYFGSRYRFFVSHREGVSENHDALFVFVPFGHICMGVPRGTPMDRTALVRYVMAQLEKLNYEGLLDVPPAHRGVLAITQCIRYSTIFWDYAIGAEAEGMPEKAERYFKAALEFYPQEELVKAYERFRERNGERAIKSP